MDVCVYVWMCYVDVCGCMCVDVCVWNVCVDVLCGCVDVCVWMYVCGCVWMCVWMCVCGCVWVCVEERGRVGIKNVCILEGSKQSTCEVLQIIYTKV